MVTHTPHARQHPFRLPRLLQLNGKIYLLGRQFMISALGLLQSSNNPRLDEARRCCAAKKHFNYTLNASHQPRLVISETRQLFITLNSLHCFFFTSRSALCCLSPSHILSAYTQGATLCQMADVTPFRVSVSDSELKYLQDRLASARYPDILDNIAPWEDGTDLEYFKGFVDYWRRSYDWRQWESKLNSLQQFTTKTPIMGIQLHFVWEKSSRQDAIPLLLLHGWPGSYFEFYKLISMLKRDGRFHIVAPSLPGYGFSSAPQQRGFGVTAIAACVDSLMAHLGYSRYLAQGGDWGAIVCRALAKYHSSSCAAIHLNMCIARPSLTNPWHVLQILNAWLLPRVPIFLSSREMSWVQDMQSFERYETGYQKIQGTKPQTLAYALQDSPVGLAAWIIEKFHSWTDCARAPDDALSKDEMLTNIMIYWAGGRIASSMRLYKETIANKAEMKALLTGYSATPCGVAVFPAELYKPPKSWAKLFYNIQQWTEMPQGGHFAALEQPELLAKELHKFADLAASSGWLAG